MAANPAAFSIERMVIIVSGERNNVYSVATWVQPTKDTSSLLEGVSAFSIALDRAVSVTFIARR
mgnify:CR=1 FL=1